MGISKETALLLKGGGALWVVLYHLNQLMPLPFIGHFIEINGMMHVGLFFFLSGYGLTKSYNYNPEKFIRNFWIRRVLYFLLPFWVINGVYTVVWCDKWQSFIQLFGYIVGYKYINPHSWFIGALFILYLIFFSVAWLRKYKKFKMEYVFLVLFFFYLCWGGMNGQKLFLSSVDFYIGMLIAANEKNIFDLVKKYKVKVLAFFSSVFILSCLLMVERLYIYIFLHRPLFVFNSVVFVLLIYCLFISVGFLRELKLRFLLWIGAISYELYLLHNIFLQYANDNYKLLSYLGIYFFSILSAFIISTIIIFVQEKLALRFIRK
ncbi:MAG: hypothetical protein BGN96_13425 [Bacteroidales bacterium 45-6]|uniref:acyltransferase family protein n=1 Tax=uncultured Dysgonomonas sp. TaxID=206096 RepID=UPI0009646BF1|nr:acyltransferase [uncultured Dysgonomonas sp.]OJU54280.1 MAG: hypothetical protein BGN96_13425 [Bacteroidales bacterium 45-6]